MAAGGDGDGLQGAAFLAAVLLVTGGDGAPGQVLELGVQAGLILLHHQEFGVVTLSVQGVGGDDGPARSRGSGNGAKQVISLVLPSTLACATTALAC